MLEVIAGLGSVVEPEVVSLASALLDALEVIEVVVLTVAVGLEVEVVSRTLFISEFKLLEPV